MIVNPDICKYIDHHNSELPDYLVALERETHLKVLMPHMISGATQGLFLKMMVSLSGAKEILEIGTFTGYAAICLALGLRDKGNITTIERDIELEEIISKYIAISGFEEQITSLMGDAKVLIPEMEKTFDFVFIDADKRGYSQYYDLVFPKLKIGGIILADNTLWKGKVLDESPNGDTKAIIEFNKKVQADPRVENTILPIRDGLHLIIKKVHD